MKAGIRCAGGLAGDRRARERSRAQTMAELGEFANRAQRGQCACEATAEELHPPRARLYRLCDRYGRPRLPPIDWPAPVAQPACQALPGTVRGSLMDESASRVISLHRPTSS